MATSVTGTELVQGPVVPIGLPEIKSLTIVDRTYAVTTEGLICAWGGYLSGGGEPPTPLVYDHTPHLFDAPVSVAEVVANDCIRLLNGEVDWKFGGIWKRVRGYGSTSRYAGNGDHACAVLANGRVGCEGYGYEGQLGDGYASDRPWAELVAPW